MHGILDGSSITIEQLVRIAHDPSVRVELAADAEARILDSERHVTRIVQEYIAEYERTHIARSTAAAELYSAQAENDSTKIRSASDQLAHAESDLLARCTYGVTTGFGEFKRIPIAPSELERLQTNILLSHAVGVGDNADPRDPSNYYSIPVVRAVLALRVNAFARGFSGIRLSTVRLLLEMLNRGAVPLVPTRGSVGSSGDLCPLSHLFSALLGCGEFVIARDAPAVQAGLHALTPQPADAGLAAHLGVPPVEIDGRRAAFCPSFKEGLALTNGATFSAAMLALAVHAADELAATSDAAASLTLEAVCGRTRALDERIHAARGMRGQMQSAATMRALLHDSALANRTESVQDAYSIRCAPQVHGASRDAIEYARGIASAEINAATDNPLFFRDGLPFDLRPSAGDDNPAAYRSEQLRHEPHAFSAGNFHGQPLALAADFLAIAVAELASISERRLQLLLDEHHNRNLPANLVARPGICSGLMILQYTAAGLVSENKVLAHPASVDSIPTSANSEDHNSMATIAARKLRTVISNAQAVLAAELLAAAQAVEWRVGRAGPRGSIDIPPDGRRPTPGDLMQASLERESRFQAEFGAPDAPGRKCVLASLGVGTRAVYRALREDARIAPYVRDDFLEPLLRGARALLERGTIAAVVRDCARDAATHAHPVSSTTK